MNLEPLVGALTGVVAFSDAFGPAQLAGGTAILVGIGLGAMPRPKRLPVDRPAVAEEAAGRTVVRERRSPHDPGRAVPHRPAPLPPMSVATQPGHTAFTSTRSPASASASMSDNALSAAFETE